jgi:hypothetical protein
MVLARPSLLVRAMTSETKRQISRMIGEALREAGVLLVVAVARKNHADRK